MIGKRLAVILGFGMASCALNAQVYVHPLAKVLGEDSYRYFLNKDGEVVAEESAYLYVRTSTREKKKDPFRFETVDRNGKLMEQGAADEPDPIYVRYSDTYLAFHPNGDTASYYAYKKGRLHGAYLEYHPSGKLKRTGQHEKGQREGEWKRFDATGKLIGVERYKDGRAFGTWEEFFPNGQVRWQLGFINGTPIGVETYYFEDGSVAQRFTYQEQNRSGSHVSYHPDGSMAERGAYLNGAKHGEWLAHHANGQLYFEGSYDTGKRTGNWLMLSEQGDTLLNGRYRDTGFEGFEQGFSLNNALVYRTDYANGVEVLTTLFDVNGDCMAVAVGDEEILRSCRDQRPIEGRGRFLPPQTDEDIVANIKGNLAPVLSKDLDLYGVYRFSVNRRGRVMNLEVINSAEQMYDQQVLGLLQNMGFKAGSFFGYPARYTTECAVRVVNGELEVLFGQPYVDDEVLLQQSHVPESYRHAHPESSPAQFIGGERALSSWLGSHQRYPDFALEQQVSGESIVQFVVEPSGILSGIEIATNASPVLDYEAIRVTRTMPLWKSGEKQGKEVRTVNKLPYRFTLR